MLNGQLPNIIIWTLLWLSSFGIFLHLHKKIFSIYIKHFILTALYFLFVTAATSWIFRSDLIQAIDGFTTTPMIVLGIVVLLHIALYVYIPKYFHEPIEYFEKYPERQYLQIDWRRLVSKSMDILSQQVFVFLLVIFLQKAGLELYGIIVAFAVIFGLVHIPLIIMERGTWSSWYFTAFSLLSAVIFPVLILKVQYGFIYSYIIHWLFYTLTAVGFWVVYSKRKSYQCEECGLKYADKEWTEKCEEWCKKYKSCNLEIINHAIKN